MGNWQDHIKTIIEQGGDAVMELGGQLMVLYSTNAPIMVRESDESDLAIVAKIQIPGHLVTNPNDPFFDEALSLTKQACEATGGGVSAERDTEDQSVIAIYRFPAKEGLPSKQNIMSAMEKIKAVIDKLF
jgi:hypothetical protein